MRFMICGGVVSSWQTWMALSPTPTHRELPKSFDPEELQDTPAGIRRKHFVNYSLPNEVVRTNQNIVALTNIKTTKNWKSYKKVKAEGPSPRELLAQSEAVSDLLNGLTHLKRVKTQPKDVAEDLLLSCYDNSAPTAQQATTFSRFKGNSSPYCVYRSALQTSTSRSGK